MAKKAKKLWLSSSPKKSKPTVPDTEKQLIEQKCNELIQTELSPNISTLHPQTMISTIERISLASGIATIFTFAQLIIVRVRGRFPRLLSLAPPA